MSQFVIPLSAAAVINALVFALAFIAAKRSREGGLVLYFRSGVAGLVLLAALPFLTAMGDSIPMRLAWGPGFVVSGVAVWLAGLFVANVRIINRLF